MADDLIVAMLSTDCNRDGLEQVRPVLERAGYTVWVGHSPGPLHDFHPEVPGWMHSDMWIAPLDRDLALVYPPWCDFETIRYLRSIGYRLLEAPRDEQEAVTPANLITIEPRVDVNRLPGLDTVEPRRLGALARTAAVERDPATHRGLREGLEYSGHPQIRNRGTVGGSLAHADPASELPTVAVALDGEIVLRSL